MVRTNAVEAEADDMAEDGRTASNLDLVGGRLCLDFANTVSTRSEVLHREYLTNYNDLVSWSSQAGILAEEEAEALQGWAVSHSDLAASVLERAIAQRELIYQIFAAVADGRRPRQGALESLNVAIRKAFSRLEISPGADGFRWMWTVEGDDPERMLWPIVRSAAELLTSEDLGRVRACARDGCDWLFVDLSKNQSRRWCSMEMCGSRVKSQRYYYRKKAESA